MVGYFVGGLAQGFGQGIKLGQEIEDARLERDYRNRMGEIAGLQMQNGQTPEDFRNFQMDQYQAATAKYNPDALPQMMYLQSSLENNALNRQTKEFELQQQKAGDQWFSNLNREVFETNPLGTMLDGARYGYDLGTIADYVGAEKNLANNLLAQQFMYGDIVGAYNGINDGMTAEQVPLEGGGAEIVIRSDADPSTVVERFTVGSQRELQDRVLPLIAEQSQEIGATLYGAVNEARREAMNNDPISSGLYKAMAEQLPAIEAQLYSEAGLTPADASPAMQAEMRRKAQDAVLQNYQYFNRAVGGGVPGAGLSPANPMASIFGGSENFGQWLSQGGMGSPDPETVVETEAEVAPVASGNRRLQSRAQQGLRPGYGPQPEQPEETMVIEEGYIQTPRGLRPR